MCEGQGVRMGEGQGARMGEGQGVWMGEACLSASASTLLRV